ncbi:MAG: thermonuclease family protein [Verrucomicrobiota bacterium]
MALVLSLAVWQGWAAQPKPLGKLTNCRYVTADYNDGDSFHVRSDRSDFVLRLYFVDAPETTLRDAVRTQEQRQYFDVTSDETIDAGLKAKEAVHDMLQQPFVVWTRRATAPGRSQLPRYYGLVEVKGTNLTEWLVSKGLARVKGVRTQLPDGQKSKTYLEKLRKLEKEAKEKRAGIWAFSKTSNSDKIPPKK